MSKCCRLFCSRSMCGKRTNCPTVGFFSTTVVLLLRRKELGLEWCWFKIWMAVYVADCNSFIQQFVVQFSFLKQLYLCIQINFYVYSKAIFIPLVLRRRILFSASQFLELPDFNRLLLKDFNKYCFQQQVLNSCCLTSSLTKVSLLEMLHNTDALLFKAVDSVYFSSTNLQCHSE